MNERNNAATTAAVTGRSAGSYGSLDKPNLHHITKVSSLLTFLGKQWQCCVCTVITVAHCLTQCRSLA